MIRTFLAAMALVAATASSAYAAGEKFLLIQLKTGTVKIELLRDVAPRHVEQISKIAAKGDYDGVAFHRVMEGFMAQTGDVEHGRLRKDGTISGRAGTGDSDLPNIPAEFSDLPFDRGTVGMARTNDPNSGNAQFFIMFERKSHLDGQYTVWGRVVEGMQHVDNIKLGSRSQNGKVTKPDAMIKVTLSNE